MIADSKQSENKVVEYEHLLSDIELLFFKPSKLSKIVKKLTKKNLKSIKGLKAAIFLQKVRNGKYKFIANNYITSQFGLFHSSFKLSTHKTVLGDEIEKYQFIQYSLDKVIDGIKKNKFNSDVSNFCLNLKNAFKSEFKNLEKQFCTDIQNILNRFAKKRRIKHSIYNNREFFDHKIFFIFCKEKSFKSVVEFYLAFNNEHFSKSADLNNLIEMDEKWKDCIENGKFDIDSFSFHENEMIEFDEPEQVTEYPEIEPPDVLN